MFSGLTSFFKNLFNFNKQVVKTELQSQANQATDKAAAKATGTLNKLIDDVNTLSGKVNKKVSE